MVRWMRCHCPPDTGFEIEPCWSTAEHTNSWSRRLPTIFNIVFTIEQGGNNLFLWHLNARAGDESAISDFPSRHQDPPPALRYCYYIYTNTLPVDLILIHRQGRCQHFSYFILHNILNVHNIYWSCHCYPLPVINDRYVFTLVLP